MGKCSPESYTVRYKCSFCDAKPQQHRHITLAEQGWSSVELRLGAGKSQERFHSRACPNHFQDMMMSLMNWIEGKVN